MERWIKQRIERIRRINGEVILTTNWTNYTNWNFDIQPRITRIKRMVSFCFNNELNELHELKFWYLTTDYADYTDGEFLF